MITNVVLSVLVQALVLIEDPTGHGHPGDGGRALGRLQMHRCVVQDVNRAYGLSLNYRRAALHFPTACKVAEKYLRLNAKPGMTPAQVARFWKCGPRPSNSQAVLDYGQRTENLYWQLLRGKYKGER